MRINVEPDISTDIGKCLDSARGHVDGVSHALDVDNNVIRCDASERSREEGDHGVILGGAGQWGN